MQLMRGSLADVLCSPSRDISWRHALAWSGDMSAALGALHTLHPTALVHRDVKPANFLLDDQVRKSQLPLLCMYFKSLIAQ